MCIRDRAWGKGGGTFLGTVPPPFPRIILPLQRLHKPDDGNEHEQGKDNLAEAGLVDGGEPAVTEPHAAEHGNHKDESKDDGIKADEPLLPVKERGPDVREQEKGDERSAPNGGPERAGQEKDCLLYTSRCV